MEFSSALKALNGSGIIAYPTEAVYGLGCDPHDESALAKIITLKGRDDSKGMIIIAATFRQLTPFLAHPDTALEKKIAAHQDNPTTWVVSAKPPLPALLTGGRQTIAIRVTQHPVAAELCIEYGGAITSTSANRSGRDPARTAHEVAHYFPDGVDAIVDAPVGSLLKPTRIIDAQTDEILR